MSQGLKGITFRDQEPGTLKAVYLLALSALGHTHEIDEKTMSYLAEAVFETYVLADRPNIPLASTQVEDLAFDSIELLARTHTETLLQKR